MTLKSQNKLKEISQGVVYKQYCIVSSCKRILFSLCLLFLLKIILFFGSASIPRILRFFLFLFKGFSAFLLSLTSRVFKTDKKSSSVFNVFGGSFFFFFVEKLDIKCYSIIAVTVSNQMNLN